MGKNIFLITFLSILLFSSCSSPKEKAMEWVSEQQVEAIAMSDGYNTLLEKDSFEYFKSYIYLNKNDTIQPFVAYSIDNELIKIIDEENKFVAYSVTYTVLKDSAKYEMKALFDKDLTLTEKTVISTKKYRK